jgi:GWxTD domain-containing protein
MKKQMVIGMILMSFLGFSQTQKVRAYLDDKQFFAPGIGDYVEIQLQFVGHSIQYQGVAGGLMGEVAVRMAIKSKDSLVASDAYRLQSPLMKDSVIEDFYDLKRFALSPGVYSLEIELQDLNAKDSPVKASKPLVVEAVGSGTYLSDIQISESVTKGNATSVFFKSGFDLIPRLSTFYPQEISVLPTYLEVYNSSMIGDSVFGLKQLITDVNGKEMENMTQFTRHKISEVVPILRPVDIQHLPTGKYSLEFVVLKRDLTEIARKSYDFERSNDLQQEIDPDKLLIDPAFQASIMEDSVLFYMASLIPMANHGDVKNILSILKSKNKEVARKQIQGFWLATAGTDYYNSWIKYKAQVQFVQKLYANNFQEGFETDRGRVYLQYGSPSNVLQKEVSSTEYPYEIWTYNKIGKFSNKRFIFYNPDLVNNGYRLLHSDMIGELKNAAWQLALNKRNSTNGDIDNPNGHVQESYGGNSNNNFRQY